MRKTEKITFEGQVMLELTLDNGHLVISDPRNGCSLKFWPDEVGQLYVALGMLLDSSSNPPGDSL